MEMTPGRAAQRGFEFQLQVAAIFLAMGAEVEQNVALAGNEIDLVVQEKTSSGTVIRTAIETKAYSKPLAMNEVYSFAAIADHLKRRGLIDRAVLVSASGFTPRVRASSGELPIELLDHGELAKRVEGQPEAVEQATRVLQQGQIRTHQTHSQRKKIFVVMPFAEAFDDVYILGIREVAERMGYVVQRADDIEHNEGILAVLQDQIRRADLVIADTTTQNPNVFYEIGFAHAADKPTILLSRKDEKIPIDLQSLNHIFYSKIVDLRTKLTKRLEAMFGTAHKDG